ncbi:MAG: hypothetical protein ACR2PK_03960, partial [Acidimicrobiales bacterium]
RAFREHFEALDAAVDGRPDNRVSERDLLHVVANPDMFEPSQVLAAEAILAEPILRHRLDTASANRDIVDSDSFGAVLPGDRVISLSDIDSFVARSSLNDLLAPYRDDLDTAAAGGRPDGWFSERDLESWLVENPNAPEQVRAGVEQMLEAGLVDRSWLEVNREALAMGAAVVAGGVVVVATGGTAAPGYVVLGSGFVAGGAAAGATTVAVNHRTGNDLRDGALSNSLNGAMIGLSVAGLPGAWTNVVANGTTISVRSVAAASALTAEVSGVVASGGVDLLLPEPWESPVRRGASATEKVSGLVAVGGKN